MSMMMVMRQVDGRPTAFGRVSRLMLLAGALLAAYAAGYASHDLAPAVFARLAAWSESPPETARAAVPAEMGPRKRRQLYRGHEPAKGTTYE